MNSPEQLPSNPEYGVESLNSASEQLEKLNNSPENTVELSPRDAEAQAEKARIKALETAVSVEAGGKEIKKGKEKSALSRNGSINKKQRNESYKRTMKQVQSELPVASRAFSKIIHNKVIEKTSDIVGSTIARPNAMLAGAVVAFILTLATYTTAKTIGYALSGFETIAAFIVGWIIGILFDYLRVLFTGKKF
jgi:hypothetical protein